MRPNEILDGPAANFAHTIMQGIHREEPSFEPISFQQMNEEGPKIFHEIKENSGSIFDGSRYFNSSHEPFADRTNRRA